MRRFISTALVLVLLGNQALAAPQGVLAVVGEMKYGAWFWWHASGWAAKFAQRAGGVSTQGWDGKGAPDQPVPKPAPQETQQQRNARVVRVEVSPRDVTIGVDEPMIFTAVAYDGNDASVGGVQFDWSALDEADQRPVTVPGKGKFASAREGNFKVKVNVDGHLAETKVTVQKIRRTPGERPIAPDKAVSSRDLPTATPKSTSSLPRTNQRTHSANQLSLFNGEKGSLVSRKVGASFVPGLKSAKADLMISATSLLQSGGEDLYGWNSGNYTTADDPGKDRGNPPGQAPDGGAGSGNFQFAAPVLALDGRGLDLNLGLAYNSRVWHKAGSQITFDIDHDWPAPGWSLGFGKIIGMGAQNGFMLVDPDGTRHAYSGNLTFYQSSQTCNCKTTDGSFIDYKVTGNTPASGGAPQTAYAYFSNGTSIYYGSAGSNAIYPMQIIDANGNMVNISYRGGQGPQINQITDTLGRVIQFYYDANNRLVAIAAPGLNGGAQRTAVRLHYRNLTLDTSANYGFSGLTPRVQQATVGVLDAIYYPATSTGYWFGDADSYSSYGMLAKVIEQRGMSFSAQPLPADPLQAADPGTVAAGSLTRQMVYNYPMASSSLTDAPTYQNMTESWAAMDVAAATTTYFAQENASPRRVEITRPDGVKTVMLSHNTPGQFNDGLIYQDETYNPQGTLLSKSFVNWEQGDYSAPRPTRMETTDERGQKMGREMSYGARFNQVTETREYDYGYTYAGTNTLLRKTVNAYLNNANYTDPLVGGAYWRHIFNLVTVNEVYAGDGVTRLSRSEYNYDEFTGTAGLQDTPGIVYAGHDLASDPYIAGAYNPITEYRGNVTTVKHYANAATLDAATAVVETRRYDITGNLVRANTACCEQTTFNYTLSTQFTWPESQTRGSATDATKQNTTAATYDFNTGLVKTGTDANGRISQTTYDANTLRPIFEYAPTNAYNYHLYDDAGLIVYDLAYEAGQSGGSFASRSDKYLDGHGRVRGEIAYTTGYTTDGVVTKYDQLGRISQQTRPYHEGETQQWYTLAYDWLDRVTQVIAPDGSVTKRYYNQVYNGTPNTAYPSVATAGAAGSTIYLKDQWSRERWARFDALNRLVEVVEPDPLGTGTVAANGLLTKYFHNALGNLTSVQQGSQTRTFRYDGLSRLTHQKLAERDAKLNDLGQHVDVVGGVGAWSDVFSYDTRSNLTQRVEARGVKTLFNYNSDPLNRLQSVQYDKSGVPAAITNNIPPAPNVSYDYLTTGDKLRPYHVYVDAGMGNQTFGYDSEGRQNSVSQTFTGREAYPVVTDYVFDTLDRVSDVTYPQRWGLAESRKIVHQTYDIASRLSGLTFDGTSFASSLVYNAASQTTALNVGSQVNESYSFDPQTGLLTNQKVQKAGTDLLNLSYGYTQTSTGAQKTGQLTQITDNKNTNRNRTYVYDQLGRLKQAQGGVNGALWSQSYAFDRYGNRTSVTKSGNAADGTAIPSDGLPSVTYNAASNRITSSGFAYDYAGNQTQATDASGVVKQYRYDTAGRLAQVYNSTGGWLATYSYGASNQRLRVQESGADTYYAWDGGAVLAEYAAAGTSGLSWARSYVYLGGRLLATLTGNGTQYQHPDRLGTRLITAASNGAVVSEQLNLPFGTALANSATFGTGEGYQSSAQPNPHKRRFTSYDRNDATATDYAVNRHYSPSQGRFTQSDPIGMDAVSLGDPQSLNMYAYVGNDPINRVDPDGLFWGKLFGVIGKILKITAIAVFVAGAVLLTAGLAAAAIGGAWAAGGVFFNAFSVLMNGVMAFLGGQPTSMIFSFAGAGAEASAWGGAIANWALVGVGAVSNLVQNKNKNEETDPNKFLKLAIENAKSALLRNRECRELIAGSKHKNAYSVLSSIQKTEGGFSLGRDSYTNTTGSGAKAKISLSSIVFDGKVAPQGVNTALGLPGNTDRLTAASVEVLHETSHATGKFSHEGYKPGDSNIHPFTLNQRILKACFP